MESNLEYIHNPILVSLKYARNDQLEQITLKTKGKFVLKHCDIEDFEKLSGIFSEYKPSNVIHLAAQAGVRYSLQNTHEYINSNIVGFNNLLESCKEFEIKHLLFASTSSVYGGNRELPFKENVNVDHPINIYSATKKANELIAHSYSHLYDLPCTGIRFFTVYGPWGRPDMALSKFVKSIIEGKPIEIYGNVSNEVIEAINSRENPLKHFASTSVGYIRSERFA